MEDIVLAKMTVYKVKIYSYISGKTFKTFVAAYTFDEAIKIAGTIHPNSEIVWVKDLCEDIYVKEKEND